MAEKFLELHERIEGAHELYKRYAKRNAANFILSDLHDNLARLLGDSPLGDRDHTPRKMDRNYRITNEVIPVQEWIATYGLPQPLAQRWERNGSIVSKETVVETVRHNLAELRSRHDYEHGLPRGVTRPSAPLVRRRWPMGQLPIRQTLTQPLPVSHLCPTRPWPVTTGTILTRGNPRTS